MDVSENVSIFCSHRLPTHKLHDEVFINFEVITQRKNMKDSPKHSLLGWVKWKRKSLCIHLACAIAH